MFYFNRGDTKKSQRHKNIEIKKRYIYIYKIQQLVYMYILYTHK